MLIFAAQTGQTSCCGLCWSFALHPKRTSVLHQQSLFTGTLSLCLMISWPHHLLRHLQHCCPLFEAQSAHWYLYRFHVTVWFHLPCLKSFIAALLFLCATVPNHGESWGMKGEWMKKNCSKKYEELGAEPSEEYFFCKVVGLDSQSGWSRILLIITTVLNQHPKIHNQYTCTILEYATTFFKLIGKKFIMSPIPVRIRCSTTF